MLLQRLHFLRRLPTNVAIYKLKERVEHSTRSFIFWILRNVPGYGNRPQQLSKTDFGLRVVSYELIIFLPYSLLSDEIIIFS